MAGIRHHILPRFLLKGFASKVVGEQVFTWVYRKGEKSFESNIINVSVETYFYGKEGEANVDDEMTDIEAGFDVLLADLRERDNAYQIPDPKMAEFVAHLSIRTKHIRDSIIETSGGLMNRFTEHLGDPNRLRSWILEYYRRHPEVMEKAIDDYLEKIHLPRHKKSVLKQRLLKMNLRPEVAVGRMDKQITRYSSILNALGPIFQKKLPTMGKEGHIKALAKGLVPQPRLEDYQKLNWFVCKSDELLILGDLGCLFEVAGKKRFISLNAKKDDLKNIYLPISSDSLVVGTPSSAMPEVNVKFLNEISAKISREFFICRESSAEMQELLPTIGTEAEILSDDEIEQLLKEIFLKDEVES